jgi:hypothetical protein
VRCQHQQRRRERERKKALIAQLHKFEVFSVQPLCTSCLCGE